LTRASGNVVFRGALSTAPFFIPELRARNLFAQPPPLKPGLFGFDGGNRLWLPLRNSTAQLTEEVWLLPPYEQRA